MVEQNTPKKSYIFMRWKDQPPIEFEMEVHDVVYDYKYQHHKLVGHATMKDGTNMRVRFRVYTMLDQGLSDMFGQYWVDDIQGKRFILTYDGMDDGENYHMHKVRPIGTPTQGSELT